MKTLRAVRAHRALAILVPITLLFVGCMHPGYMDSARKGPHYAPTNHLGEPSLGGIRRVVLLPVWGGGVANEEAAAALDEVVLSALQHQNRFEVVTLPREIARRKFRSAAFSSAAALPHDLLNYLVQEYAVEGVVFVDLTVYRPYPPLGIGLRAKLATTEGTRLIWTFDEVFSADDIRVANAARNHFLDLDRRVPADMTHGVLQSPSRFTAYAAAAMFRTLPPVLPPPLPRAAKVASKP